METEHQVHQIASEPLENAHVDFQSQIASVGVDTLVTQEKTASEYGETVYEDDVVECIVVNEATLQRLARRAGVKPQLRHGLFAHYEDMLQMAGAFDPTQSVLVVVK